MSTSRLIRALPSRAAWRAIALLAAMLSAATTLRAQASGSIEGTVRDAKTRSPLADVMVMVRDTRRGGMTDADGKFRITAVAAGTHTVIAQMLGRASDSASVTVPADSVARVELALREAAVMIAPTVVSATREAQRRADASATIDVLNGAEIRLARASHPAGVMQRIAGVHISQLSGEGHSTAIRQPITTKPMYLYLEDGVPTRSTGFFNHNALYEVNIPQSGGLEVLKGPGTAMYGSDAIGGVVNVLTRPAPASPTVEASLEGGAYGYARMLATGGFTRGTSGVRADLNITHSDSWRDAAPYQRQSATVRWDYAGASGLTMRTVLTGTNVNQRELATLSAAQFDRDASLNLSPIGFRKVQALRLSSAIERERGSSLWSLTPYARYDVYDLMPTWQLSYNPEVWNTKNTSAGLLAKYRRDFAPMRARVIVGADLDLSPGSFLGEGIAARKVGADSAWASYTVSGTHYDYDVTYRQLSPYVHAELSPLPRVRLDGGLRYDASGFVYDSKLAPVSTGRWRVPGDTTVSYRRLSPKVGITVDVAPGLNVYASYREGFRAPSQSQLFQQGSNANTVGLEPVTAASAEVGVRGDVGSRLLYTVAAYDMRIHNDIMSVLDAEGRQTVSNAGETRHRGVELSLGAAVTPTVRVDASYATTVQRYVRWLAPVGSANVSYAGKTIEAAPHTLANVLATWIPSALRGGRLAVEWSHTGRYYEDAENTHTYDGFDLVTLHANYMLHGGTELFARMTNALDVKYAELASYNPLQKEQFNPGSPRMIFAGVKVGWQR